MDAAKLSKIIVRNDLVEELDRVFAEYSKPLDEVFHNIEHWFEEADAVALLETEVLDVKLWKEAIRLAKGNDEDDSGGYNDTLDSDLQITTEEAIAGLILDEVDRVHGETAAKLGRQILKLVLKNFRPDLFELRAIGNLAWNGWSVSFFKKDGQGCSLKSPVELPDGSFFDTARCYGSDFLVTVGMPPEPPKPSNVYVPSTKQVEVLIDNHSGMVSKIIRIF